LPDAGNDALAIVIVTHQSAAHLRALSAALAPQLRADDELVIVDNASSDGTAALARSLDAHARVVETGANLGFAGGCHAGADASSAPLLFFLNPDSQPAPDCLRRLRTPARARPDWGAWQAAVMLEDERINTSGGIVHYLGIGWAGDCERPASQLPEREREIAFPSGAAMVVRRDAWDALGGLDRAYFMYGEDLDLGLRLWLTGYRVGLVPGARVLHSYEFDKGAGKWFWLERNRWRTVLSVYPGALLALVLPALLAAEAGLLVIAARDGWLGAKLRAQAAALTGLPSTLARRRRVQRARRVGAAQLAAQLTSSLESAYLGDVARSPLAAVQAAYWRAVRRALGVPAPPR
jgi:N-acetylglucosaminyl-diphospho-decaprenol L-rhamnosyltransferase